MRVGVLVGLVMLVCSAADAAQEPGPARTAAAATQMVRAAGMPLQDGALPPGALTVRVVRGAFAADLTGVTVEIDIGGDTRRAETGAKGRAEFAHLPIGVELRVSAQVSGERLASDPFQMPAESGIRVLLVTGAGEGAAVPAPPGAHAPPAVATPVAVRAPTAAAPAGRAEGVAGVTAVRVTIVSLTILAFAGVGGQRLRQRRAGAARSLRG